MNANDFFATFGDHAANLYGRWQDEREYEDFADYVANIKREVEALGGVFVSATSRPFHITFELDGKRYKIKVTSRTVSMVEMIRRAA